MMHGTPLSEHRFTWTGLLQTTWPLLVLGSLCLAFGVMFQVVPTQPGQETGTRIAGIVAILGSLAMLGVVPWRWLRRPSLVQVYPEGLAWQQGGRRLERSWDDVEKVYRKEVYVLQNNAKPSDWNRRSDLRLVFTDDTQVRFNHTLSGYDRLAGSIQQMTAERMLPRARAALQGSGVGFGSLQLSQEGVALGADVFPWATLSKVWAGNGVLGWYDSRGNKREVALKDIPNYSVLLHLLQERTPAASGG